MPTSESDHMDGRSTRWIAHRTARRAELLETARHVLGETGPVVAMDELAAAMGTSKSILYRYFEDRDGLREALAAAVVCDLGAAPEPGGDPLTASIHRFLRTVAAEPDVYLFVSGSPGATDPEGAAGVSDGIYEAAVLRALGEPFVGLPAVQRSAAIGSLRGATTRWLAAGTARDEAEIEAVAGDVATWLREGVLSQAS